MDDLLEKLEADAYGILRATASLADAQIVRADEGLTEADVAQKLVTLTGTEKKGLGIVILPAEIDKAEREQPGPPVKAMVSVQVIEAVIINRGETGTGIKANVAAIRVLNALHHQRMGNRLLYAEKNPVEALPMKAGFVGYMVTLYSEANGGTLTGRVRQLAFSLDENGDLVIETATAGAAIYYTTDGSFPGAANEAATLYSAPLEITDNDTFRACAFLSPLLPSDISEVTVSIVDDIVSLNGETVTMGGDAVLL